MKRCAPLFTLLLGTASLAQIQAQTPAAAPAAPAVAVNPALNLVSNGSFEQFTTRDNLWDGIDSDNNLASERMSLPALTESGGVGDMAMPVSVAAGDLNRDGLVDIVTADPAGWFRAYFNKGTKDAPKYGNAEMIPIFLSRPKGNRDDEKRFGSRIALADVTRDGALDIVVGNYFGEMSLLENKSSVAPTFVQPATEEAAMFPTSKDNKAWGNLFAPALWDFDKDGKLDLLLGEGSYSANAIHLLLNQGSGNAPKFTEEKKYYLCYGDGREQLTPAVVDYNGDGLMDVLVADRKGTIAVHLNEATWKPGAEFKNASLVSFGSTTSLGGIVTVTTADLNGDNLFDIIIGKNNGRVAMSLNKGTAQQPKFDPLTDIKGEDLWKRNVTTPTGWSTHWGQNKGNLYGYIISVGEAEDAAAKPADGKRALKVGYWPSPNQIIKMVPLDIEPRKAITDAGLFAGGGGNQMTDAMQLVHQTSTNTFILTKAIGKPPVPGKTYILSFKVKGAGFTGRYSYAYSGSGQRSQAKVTKKERGVAIVDRDVVNESKSDGGNISPTSEWTQVTKAVTVKFGDRELNAPDTWKGVGKPSYNAMVNFVFQLKPFDGVAYIDDVQLVEKVQ